MTKTVLLLAFLSSLCAVAISSSSFRGSGQEYTLPSFPTDNVISECLTSGVGCDSLSSQLVTNVNALNAACFEQESVAGKRPYLYELVKYVELSQLLPSEIVESIDLYETCGSFLDDTVSRIELRGANGEVLADPLVLLLDEPTSVQVVLLSPGTNGYREITTDIVIPSVRNNDPGCVSTTIVDTEHWIYALQGQSQECSRLQFEILIQILDHAELPLYFASVLQLKVCCSPEHCCEDEGLTCCGSSDSVSKECCPAESCCDGKCCDPLREACVEGTTCCSLLKACGDICCGGRDICAGGQCCAIRNSCFGRGDESICCPDGYKCCRESTSCVSQDECCPEDPGTLSCGEEECCAACSEDGNSCCPVKRSCDGFCCPSNEKCLKSSNTCVHRICPDDHECPPDTMCCLVRTDGCCPRCVTRSHGRDFDCRVTGPANSRYGVWQDEATTGFQVEYSAESAGAESAKFQSRCRHPDDSSSIVTLEQDGFSGSAFIDVSPCRDLTTSLYVILEYPEDYPEEDQSCSSTFKMCCPVGTAWRVACSFNWCNQWCHTPPLD